jgi:hypothetical protein
MYNVVFVYTKAAGGYEGVRTWSDFGTKEKFQTWLAEQKELLNNVIAEGVTEDRAKELIAKTPIRAYLCSAVHEAVELDGSFNSDKYKTELETILAANPKIKPLDLSFVPEYIEKNREKIAEIKKDLNGKEVKFSQKMVYQHEEQILTLYKEGKQDLQTTIDRLKEEMMLVTSRNTVIATMKEHGIELEKKQLEGILFWEDS